MYLAAAVGSSAATRPLSAATFTVQQWGNSAAQMAPWGACKSPPNVPEKPCTAPSLALARDKPPQRRAAQS